MYSLEWSFLSSLKLPADLSAGISTLTPTLLRDNLHDRESRARSSLSATQTLLDKKHVHSSDAARKGYLEALHYIHQHKPALTIDTLLCLHEKVFYYLDQSAGDFKQQENFLFNRNSQGDAHLVHRPISVDRIPDVMNQWIEAYHKAVSFYDPLIVIPLALLDFILIHPFYDGNGRMFRLLSVLLLYQSGMHRARDLNFDHVLQNSRGSGQKALHAAVEGWRDSRHNVQPWLRYCISAISYASILAFQ